MNLKQMNVNVIKYIFFVCLIYSPFYTFFLDERISINYFSVIPTVPEFNADRSLGPLRLREIKKVLDNGQGIQDIESIAHECMNDIVELCSGKMYKGMHTNSILIIIVQITLAIPLFRNYLNIVAMKPNL